MAFAARTLATRAVRTAVARAARAPAATLPARRLAAKAAAIEFGQGGACSKGGADRRERASLGHTRGSAWHSSGEGWQCDRSEAWAVAAIIPKASEVLGCLQPPAASVAAQRAARPVSLGNLRACPGGSLACTDGAVRGARRAEGARRASCCVSGEPHGRRRCVSEACRRRVRATRPLALALTCAWACVCAYMRQTGSLRRHAAARGRRSLP